MEWPGPPGGRVILLCSRSQRHRSSSGMMADRGTPRRGSLVDGGGKA